ncbi:protein draper-like [Hylaeus anthracinus]|uniref:protein draper-like n=1 Tax=Hylaeus anthracinus TaxID=313031 RepID=UPI0023B97071|nr:protein draper-like [Hylaeus anthracinus]XP_054015550.1 protein draper-like [Hylaeus anthracinus]
MASLIWLVAPIAILGIAHALEGPNICTIQKTYTVTVKISEQKPYTVRENTWCFSFPPRCSKYKVVYKTVFKEQELVKERPVEECCKGYTETTAGDRCIPICSEDCVHGTCMAPDFCKCESGYGGPLCDFSKHDIHHLCDVLLEMTTQDLTLKITPEKMKSF